MGNFCPPGSGSEFRIRIPNPDLDPLARLNPDPIRIRIRNPGLDKLLVTWPWWIFQHVSHPIVSCIFILTIRSTYPTWSGSVGGTVWISCWSRGPGGYSSTCPIPSSHVFLYLLEEAHILPGARGWAGPVGQLLVMWPWWIFQHVSHPLTYFYIYYKKHISYLQRECGQDHLDKLLVTWPWWIFQHVSHPIVSCIFIFTRKSTYPTWSGSVGGTSWISCWSRGPGGYSSTCPIISRSSPFRPTSSRDKRYFEMLSFY